MNFEQKRRQLVEFLKGSGAIKSTAVEIAFLKVKRELFLGKWMEKDAYLATALPIGSGQTISQPTTIAVMLELLEAGKGMNVLEVGSGSGYVAALLSEIVESNGRVTGMELEEELIGQSKKNLNKQGCKNVEIVKGDGSLGSKEKAPFDRILVSAACPFVPKPLFDQLKEGGRIVAPVGDKFTQAMQTLKKKNGRPLKEQYLESYFVFVPLKGEHGFR